MSKQEPLSRRSFLNGRRLFGRLLDVVREADLERAAAECSAAERPAPDLAETRLDATDVRQPRRESPAPWARSVFADETANELAAPTARASWRPTTRDPFAHLEPSE